MSDKDKENIKDLEPKEDAKGGLVGDYFFEVKPQKPGEGSGVAGPGEQETGGDNITMNMP